VSGRFLNYCKVSHQGVEIIGVVDFPWRFVILHDMKIKKEVFERVDVRTILPKKKSKPFDQERFLRLSRELREAVAREEKKYGPMRDTHLACE
jgi:hypothetical protein